MEGLKHASASGSQPKPLQRGETRFQTIDLRHDDRASTADARLALVFPCPACPSSLVLSGGVNLHQRSAGRARFTPRARCRLAPRYSAPRDLRHFVRGLVRGRRAWPVRHKRPAKRAGLVDVVGHGFPSAIAVKILRSPWPPRPPASPASPGPCPGWSATPALCLGYSPPRTRSWPAS